MNEVADSFRVFIGIGGWLTGKRRHGNEVAFDGLLDATFAIARRRGRLLEQQIEARVGRGHGGTDLFEDWRLIDCLRNGLPLDQDVYDAATWSVIIPLSIQSVANGSAPVEFPDFTSGRWASRPPVEVHGA